MNDALNIKYFGWSCFSISSSPGELLFDPVYRRYCGAKWANLEDFKAAKLILLTHGHQEHYFDTGPVARNSAAAVVAPKEICKHLNYFYRVKKGQCFPIEHLKPIEIFNLKITSVPWRHRVRNLVKNVLRPQIIEGIKWTWNSLIKCPFYAPYTGYHIEFPNGLRILNYGEGFNNDMILDDVVDLGKRFQTDILLAGYQLNFEEYVAKGAAALAPKTVILYHPHEYLFKQLGIQTSSPEVFSKAIKKYLPDVKTIIAQPSASFSFKG